MKPIDFHKIESLIRQATAALGTGDRYADTRLHLAAALRAVRHSGKKDGRKHKALAEARAAAEKKRAEWWDFLKKVATSNPEDITLPPEDPAAGV